LSRFKRVHPLEVSPRPPKTIEEPLRVFSVCKVPSFLEGCLTFGVVSADARKHLSKDIILEES
jgi:hypothetical protein